MFSRPRPDAGDPVTAAPQPPRGRDAAGGRGSTFSIIGSDVTITGDLTASVDLHVDGRIQGDVKCASLVQGGASVIAGSIVAESARLAGTVEGSIEAIDLVIEASARIIGDVTYENITIAQGGHIEGSFRHRTAQTPALRNKTVELPRDPDPLQLTVTQIG